MQKARVYGLAALVGFFWGQMRAFVGVIWGQMRALVGFFWWQMRALVGVICGQMWVVCGWLMRIILLWMRFCALCIVDWYGFVWFSVVVLRHFIRFDTAACGCLGFGLMRFRTIWSSWEVQMYFYSCRGSKHFFACRWTVFLFWQNLIGFLFLVLNTQNADFLHFLFVN